MDRAARHWREAGIDYSVSVGLAALSTVQTAAVTFERHVNTGGNVEIIQTTQIQQVTDGMGGLLQRHCLTAGGSDLSRIHVCTVDNINFVMLTSCMSFELLIEELRCVSHRACHYLEAIYLLKKIKFKSIQCKCSEFIFYLLSVKWISNAEGFCRWRFEWKKSLSQISCQKYKD